MDLLTLHPATENDLPQILEIEKASFPSPWSINTFITTLYDDRCKCLIARYEGAIVGYCFALDMKVMIHLLNLAVHPDYRKKGVAKRLMNEIISHARACNKSYVFLEVRKSNQQARCLYESMGFCHVSTWRQYYTDTREDADVMVKRLDGEMR